MRFRDLLHVSLGNILRTRGRALLTTLGIVIGIASVILMVAIGEAAEKYLLSQVASFGPDVLFVANGSGADEQRGPPNLLQKQSLTERDYRELHRKPWVRHANATVILSDIVTYESETLFGQIYGSTPDEIAIFPSGVLHGRFLLEEDIDAESRVVVLGLEVARRLFGDPDEAVGKLIKIKRQNYRVVGVMQKAGTRFFTKLDDVLYVPFTTAMRQYNRNRLNFISVLPEGISPARAKEEIRLVLRDTHRLDNPTGDLAKDDFQVNSQEDAARNANTIGQILQILLGSVAAISLVVGGIGIMNIMYVTVTERTSEIGLRKSIGARQRDVLGQFLAEAVVLTVVGGILGILFGVACSALAIQIISRFQDGWSFVMPWNGMMVAFGVSAAIGIVFGFFPARKAARLNPIEALRYE